MQRPYLKENQVFTWQPYLSLQNKDGQIEDAHSISAGLDYPGIGPEHAWLKEIEELLMLMLPTMRP